MDRTCEVCGEARNSGNDYSETREGVPYTIVFRLQGGQGWNNQNCTSKQEGNNNFTSNFNSKRPSLRDNVYGQEKITKI